VGHGRHDTIIRAPPPTHHLPPRAKSAQRVGQQLTAPIATHLLLRVQGNEPRDLPSRSESDTHPPSVIPPLIALRKGQGVQRKARERCQSSQAKVVKLQPAQLAGCRVKGGLLRCAGSIIQGAQLHSTSATAALCLLTQEKGCVRAADHQQQ
jgi:hypothetical protein